jgi:hypothetical protein
MMRAFAERILQVMADDMDSKSREEWKQVVNYENFQSLHFPIPLTAE